MKRAVKKITVLLLLLMAAPPGWSLTFPATIWFLDGTIKSNVGHIVFDSTNMVIVYLDRNKFKEAYFDEVFAVTTSDDTIIITSVTKLDKYRICQNDDQMFLFLKGIHDGFKSKHYKTFLTSTAITYFSNLLMLQQNVIVRNLPSMVYFLNNASKPLDMKFCADYYSFGYKIGLQKRKVVETAAGTIAGIYLEMATEALLFSNGN